MRGKFQVGGHFDDAHAHRLQRIARLRMIVGFLGEKSQHHWWSSEFLSATAPAFLNPVFGKTAALAQYHGVKEAARRVHDEHIGVGRVFHLFRLPETTEQALFEMLRNSAVAAALGRDVESQEVAAAALHEIARSSETLREGPVQIGSITDLDNASWLPNAARCYEAAFNSGLRAFPYLADGT